MTKDDIQSLAARLSFLEHPCDLDLFVFFCRHPRALLTSEQLVAYLGYDTGRIALSIERLIGAGVLQRSVSPTPHAARLYVVAPAALPGGQLADVAVVASTRAGRLELVKALKTSRPPNHSDEPKGERGFGLLRRIQ